MSRIHTKIYLFSEDGTLVEIRRVGVDRSVTLDGVLQQLRALYGIQSSKHTIKYQDQEGDEVLLESQEEWEECLVQGEHATSQLPLRLFVTRRKQAAQGRVRPPLGEHQEEEEEVLCSDNKSSATKKKKKGSSSDSKQQKKKDKKSEQKKKDKKEKKDKTKKESKSSEKKKKNVQCEDASGAGLTLSKQQQKLLEKAERQALKAEKKARQAEVKREEGSRKAAAHEIKRNAKELIKTIQLNACAIRKEKLQLWKEMHQEAKKQARLAGKGQGKAMQETEREALLDVALEELQKEQRQSNPVFYETPSDATSSSSSSSEDESSTDKDDSGEESSQPVEPFQFQPRVFSQLFGAIGSIVEKSIQEVDHHLRNSAKQHASPDSTDIVVEDITINKPTQYPTEVERLMELGFERSAVVSALEATSGNVEEALECLFTNI